MADKIEFFKHNIGRREIADVVHTLRGLFLTTGDEVAKFENDFAAFLGLPQAVGLSSCTAALQLSYTGLGVGPGHEVITTPLSFAATALAVIQAGATPVFVDVEPDTGNIDPGLIEKAVTPRTRAISPVHLYGQLCDMKRIREIADRHGLVVVEDAAHALEAARDGVRTGELGDAACFSFYPTKSITCGEGGAVATRHADLAEKIRLLRHHGMSRSAVQRYGKDDASYEIAEMGWKYNMSNVQAALLYGQLARAWKLHARRVRLMQVYRAGLAAVPGVCLLPEIPGSRHAGHLFTIHVPARIRSEFFKGLRQRGIGVSINFKPIHLLKFFRDRFGLAEGDFPVAEAIGASTISLPLYPRLTYAEARLVVEAVRETAAELGLR